MLHKISIKDETENIKDIWCVEWEAALTEEALSLSFRFLLQGSTEKISPRTKRKDKKSTLIKHTQMSKNKKAIVLISLRKIYEINLCIRKQRLCAFSVLNSAFMF